MGFVFHGEKITYLYPIIPRRLFVGHMVRNLDAIPTPLQSEPLKLKHSMGGIIKFTRGSYLFLFITTRERDIKIKGAKKYPSIGKSKSVWITINLFAQSKCNYFQFWSSTLDFISSTMKMFLQKKKSSSVHSINKLMHIRNII